MCKIITTIILLAFTININAGNYILKKYRFNTFIERETSTDRIIDELDYQGIVFNAIIDGDEWFSVGGGGESMLEAMIVNSFVDTPYEDTLVEFKQGGQMYQGQPVTMSIALVYDITTSKSVPDFIRIQIDGHNKAFELHGLVELTDPAQGFETPLKIVNFPSVYSSTANHLTINHIVFLRNETIVEFSDNNTLPDGYYQWFNINRKAYLEVNGKQYTMTKADGIEIAPEKTYFGHPNEWRSFTLHFPAVPTTASSMNFIEEPDSEWKLYGISLTK